MKSAYELAMERLQAEQGNGPALTDAQRDEIAELEAKHKSAVAEAEIMMQQKVVEAQMKQDFGALATLSEHHAQDVARLDRKLEEDRKRVWDAAGSNDSA